MSKKHNIAAPCWDDNPAETMHFAMTLDFLCLQRHFHSVGLHLGKTPSMEQNEKTGKCRSWRIGDDLSDKSVAVTHYGDCNAAWGFIESLR